MADPRCYVIAGVSGDDVILARPAGENGADILERMQPSRARVLAHLLLVCAAAIETPRPAQLVDMVDIRDA